MKTQLEIAIKKVRNTLKRVLDESEKALLRAELKRLKVLHSESQATNLHKVNTSLVLVNGEKLSA